MSAPALPTLRTHPVTQTESMMQIQSQRAALATGFGPLALALALACSPAAAAERSPVAATKAQAASGGVSASIQAAAGKQGLRLQHASKTIRSIDLFPGQGIVLVAGGAVHDDADSDGLLDAGESIDYHYTVLNVGDSALSSLALTDLAGAVSCPQTTLAIGAHMVCTRSYGITGADATAGAVSNTVEVQGQDAGARAVQAVDVLFTQNLAAAADIRVFKSPQVVNDADASGGITAGDLLRYTFVVKNGGAEDLSSIGLVEPDPDRIDTPIVCDANTLDGAAFGGNGGGALASSDTVRCSADYTVRASDASLGQVLNLVQASGTAPVAGLVSASGASAVVAGCGGFATVRGRIWRDDNRDGSQQLPGEAGLHSLISLLPVGADPQLSRIQATDDDGDYVFAQVPVGQVEVRVPDSYLGNVLGLYAVSGNAATIDVADCDVVDVDFGYAPPQAGVVGDFVWFDQNADTAVNEFFDADDDGVLTLNTGEVSLADFEWIDLNGNGIPDAGEFNRCGLVGVPVQLLDAGGNAVAEQLTDIRGAYFFGDLPLGSAYSTRVDPADPRVFPPVQAMAATGLCKDYTPPVTAAKSGPVGCGNTKPLTQTSIVLGVSTPVDDTLDFGLLCANPAAVGAIDLVKAIESGDPFQTAGDSIVYSYTVTNTGPVSLAGPVTVTDDRVAVSCPDLSSIGDGDAIFDVGETLVCTATYTVTLDDVLAGSVTNTAQAFAGGVSSNLDTATAVRDGALPVPVIGVSKALGSLSGSDPYQLRFDIVVRNYGVVDLSDVQVTEDLRQTFPLPVEFSVTSLVVNGTAVANAGFDGEGDVNLLDASQSNLAVGGEIGITLTIDLSPQGERGPFFNTVTASGRDALDTVVSDDSVSGANPDPDGDGIPDEATPTPIRFPGGPVLPRLEVIPSSSLWSLLLLGLLVAGFGLLHRRH